jgi:hypothetical protein
VSARAHCISSGGEVFGLWCDTEALWQPGI